MRRPLRIFFSAGEASGDRYGGLLIQALRNRIGPLECFGCGGDHMRAAGCQTLVDAHRISMVGLLEVVPGLLRAWQALRLLSHSIDTRPPDLAVLIDFPDFNLRLARRLKRRNVPVLYFVAPQVWAWRPWRLKTIRRFVDRLACIFPFEEAFFREAGVDAAFVGHPLAARVAPSASGAAFRENLHLPPDLPFIALLPGSRTKEILLNLPPMLQAASLIAAQTPCSFVLPAASTIDAAWLRSLVARSGLPVVVAPDSTYDALAHAELAVVASGTAATEAALLGTPMVIVYRVSRATWLMGRWLVRVPFFSMVNLVAGREVAPEFIQDRFQPELVAAAAMALLKDHAMRSRMRSDLQQIAAQLRLPSAVPGSEPTANDPIQRVAALAESILLEPSARRRP
jgi:lipid-A-disaccharide synthase